MKKRCNLLIALLILLVMVVCSFSTAESDEITYVIKQHDVSLSIPSGYVCATRETAESDEFYQQGLYDYSTLHQTLFNGNVYLLGYTMDAGVLTLNIYDDVYFDFDSADSQVLASIVDAFTDQSSSQETDVVEYSMYRGNNGRTLFIHLKQGERHTLSYSATHETNSFHLNYSSNNEISNEQAAGIRSIFESIVWHQPQIDEEIRYDYQEAGIHFTVPKGWKWEVTSEESDHISLKMVPPGNNAPSDIVFSCSDIWDRSSVEELKNMGFATRKDLDSILIQQLLSMAADPNTIEYKMETYSDVLFGVVWANQQTNKGYKYISTTALAMHNGYYIIFDMIDPNEKYGDVFTDVLKSVSFD